MTFVPVVPWPLLLVLGVAALAAIWWNPSQDAAPGESRGTHWRLTAAVILFSLAALRPGLPGDEAETTAANVNVYFVIDTTSSMVAEDHGADQPRMHGVRADVTEIAEALPGARFSVVTFDNSARVRLPLTSDTNALGAAVDTIVPEPPEYSRGTSVTEADERLGTLLQQASSRHPERGRFVFYLGDGEHTAQAPPAAFTVPRGLIHGGAVLGYGSEQGGRMQSNPGRYGSAGRYIQDPGTGEDALSRLDEQTLRSLASQLGLPYVHRSAGAPVDEALATVDLDRFGTSEELERERLRGREELYWLLLVGLALVGAWEVGTAASALWDSRSRRRSRP
ncbi:MAG TPA: VWA domain-containing protein [Dermatophilaceae bacterium]|nr:VWA domain-containing protein [Dermatophilaceae bacterium]